MTYIKDPREHVRDRPEAEPYKVLVVDDERELADLTAALLCSYGLAISVAYS
jgi:CheY-like chemotaxis protein